MLEKLKKSLIDAPIVKKGDYDYVIHPITDGVPELDPELVDEVDEEIIRIANKGFDKIVTAEAMGIPVGTGLSLKLKKPLVIIRKRKYSLPGEVEVSQETGYSKSNLYINGLKKGDKILIVDDVISTGGTMISVVEALKKMGVKIIDTIIVVEKGRNKEMVEKKLGLAIKSIIKIEVVDNQVRIMGK